jgi:DNA invertase Pin-like site-specific DNA recombinase
LTDRDFDFISVDNPTASKLQKHIQASFDQNVAEETSRNTKLSLAAAKKKGVTFGGNSKKRIRTLKRKKRIYLKKIRRIIRREQKKHTTLRDLTTRFNRIGLKKLNGKKGGWQVSEVHGLLHDLSSKK